jgi:DNA-binding ferritin-like protein (Dps family)
MPVKQENPNHALNLMHDNRVPAVNLNINNNPNLSPQVAFLYNRVGQVDQANFISCIEQPTPMNQQRINNAIANAERCPPQIFISNFPNMNEDLSKRGLHIANNEYKNSDMIDKHHNNPSQSRIVLQQHEPIVRDIHAILEKKSSLINKTNLLIQECKGFGNKFIDQIDKISAMENKLNKLNVDELSPERLLLYKKYVNHINNQQHNLSIDISKYNNSIIHVQDVLNRNPDAIPPLTAIGIKNFAETNNLCVIVEHNDGGIDVFGSIRSGLDGNENVELILDGNENIEDIGHFSLKSERNNIAQLGKNTCGYEAISRATGKSLAQVIVDTREFVDQEMVRPKAFMKKQGTEVVVEEGGLLIHGGLREYGVPARNLFAGLNITFSTGQTSEEMEKDFAKALTHHYARTPGNLLSHELQDHVNNRMRLTYLGAKEIIDLLSAGRVVRIQDAAFFQNAKGYVQKDVIGPSFLPSGTTQSFNFSDLSAPVMAFDKIDQAHSFAPTIMVDNAPYKDTRIQNGHVTKLPKNYNITYDRAFDKYQVSVMKDVINNFNILSNVINNYHRNLENFEGINSEDIIGNYIDRILKGHTDSFLGNIRGYMEKTEDYRRLGEFIIQEIEKSYMSLKKDGLLPDIHSI